MVVSFIPTTTFAAGETSNVAKIGTVEYATLGEAVAAVDTNSKTPTTITLLRNAEGSGIIVDKKNIIFDFDGHSYTVDKTPLAGSEGTKSQCFQLLKGSKVTFKNGTILCGDDLCVTVIQNYSDLTLDNIIVDGTNLKDAHAAGDSSKAIPNYTLSNNYGVVSIKNGSKIIAREGHFAFDAYYYGNTYDIYKEGTQVTVEDSTIIGKIEVSDGTASTLIVKSGSFTDLGSAIKYADSKTNVSLKLAKNVNDSVVIPEGKNITLDLAGYTLDGGTASNKAALTNYGTVTVKDSVGSGAIKRSDTKASNSSYYTILNEGTMTIDSGKIYNQAGKSPEQWAGASLICNGLSKNSKLTINGGTIQQDRFIAIKNDECGHLIINDGTVSSKTHAVQNWKDAEIKGGTSNGIISTWTYNNTASTTTISDNAVISGSIWGIKLNYNGSEATNIPKIVINNGKFDVKYEFGHQTTVAGEDFISDKDSDPGTKSADIKITGGHFTSDPSEYKADNYYVIPSTQTGYNFMVTNTQPESASVIVADKTTVTVPEDNSLTESDKTTIKKESKVDGIAEALKEKAKDKILEDNLKGNELENKDNIVTVEISVNVEVSKVTQGTDSELSSITFKAEPTAQVKVNGEPKGNPVKVENKDLDGKKITVKLPLPEGFEPKQIKHVFSDGRTEFFLLSPTRGAKTFTIEDGCAVFEITGFSTFELSPVVTYVAPSSYGGGDGNSYSITTEKIVNGEITVSTKEASGGSTVTVTAAPDSGYELDYIKVLDKNNASIDLTDKGNGKYTFKMPFSNVTVKAGFTETVSVPDFTDVPKDAYYAVPVDWAVKNSITEGVGSNLFAPDTACNRAQIVTFMWLAAGTPQPKGSVIFIDVPDGKYFSNAIAWATEHGIIKGVTENTFALDMICTREQMATILYRFAISQGMDVSVGEDTNILSYYDADQISEYAIPAVQWAVGAEIMTGAKGYIMPKDECTRAQFVTMLYRMMV